MMLKDTAKLMCSEDYKERFVAEYYQTFNRYLGLREMLRKWDSNRLTFEPICPRSTYDIQLQAMKQYLSVLEARAVMEHINLADYE